MAMVFQSYALYPHMSVRENLRFGLVCQKVAEGRDRRRASRRAADILQIAHLLERQPSQLSGGQSQRVAIGRAIVKEPKAFLFDEPLSNLDAELRVKMRSEIVSLHRRLGSTMVYVTHDQVEAMTMADTIVVLRDGVIEQIGSPIELYSRPRNRFVACFLGAPQMNMLAGRFEFARPARRADRARPWPRGHEASVAASGVRRDGECTVGIRPEHLIPSERAKSVPRSRRRRWSAPIRSSMRCSIWASALSPRSAVSTRSPVASMAYSVDQRFVHAFGADDSVLAPIRSWKDDYLLHRQEANEASLLGTFPRAQGLLVG